MNGVSGVSADAFMGNHSERLSVTWHYNPTFTASNFATHLTEVIFPTNVSSIGANAFAGCTRLTTLNIPVGITSISSSTAFENTSSLESITVNANNMSFASRDGILYNRQLTSFTHIPQRLSGNITIPNTINTIPSQAFLNRTQLTGVVVPNSVISIGQGAFMGCTNLQSITIPFVGLSQGSTSFNSVFGAIFGWTTTTGASVIVPFGQTHQLSVGTTHYHYSIPSNLRTVTIGGSSVIPANAFNNCSNLTSITLPSALFEIGADAFRNCSSITNMVVPPSVTSIGRGAFRGCSSLQSLTIPFVGLSASAISHEAVFGAIFDWTTTSLTFPPSGQIHQFAEGDTHYHYFIPSNLSTVIVTNTTIISENAFIRVISLQNITLPSGLTEIGANAFTGCINVTAVTIPSTVSTIGATAFGNWGLWQTIRIQGRSSAPIGWASNWHGSTANLQWGVA
jgi:hypothetical protein